MMHYNIALNFFSSLFVQPMYDSILLEQSMIYNRRKDEFNLRDRLAIIDSEEERNILADDGLFGQLWASVGILSIA